MMTSSITPERISHHPVTTPPPSSPTSPMRATMRNRSAAMSRIVIVVVAIPIRNRLLVNDRVRHGNGDRDGVYLRRVAVVDWRLVVGVVVASIWGGMVVVGRVVGRVVVVWVVVVWVGTSRGVRD